MKIGYYPFENYTNKYTEISQRSIREAGFEIIDMESKECRRKNGVECVILNWYESVSPSNILKACYRIMLRTLRLIRFKFDGISIITTFHNKQPHDIKNKAIKYVITVFYKWIIRVSDKIIVLTNDSKNYLRDYIKQEQIEKKCFLIPHPNYIDEDRNLGDDIISPSTFRLLFAGRVKPYKNIEILIDAVNELIDLPIELTIVGLPSGEKYASELKNRVRNSSRIRFDFKFVAEEDLKEYLKQSAIIILPYDIKSSMNSGTAVLAFSNHRTIICPMISTLTDFDEKLYYSYTYSNDNEHKNELKRLIKQAYNDWKNNYQDYISKGNELYRIVKDQNSTEQLSKRYKELLCSIK